MLSNFLLVGAGGAIGAMARFGVYQIFALFSFAGYWATLTVNAFGSFLMGALAIWIYGHMGQGSNITGLFLMTGVLGGFTTFSAFSLDVVFLAESGRQGMALLYILLSLGLSVAFLMAGMVIMRGRIL